MVRYIDKLYSLLTIAPSAICCISSLTGTLETSQSVDAILLTWTVITLIDI